MFSGVFERELDDGFAAGRFRFVEVNGKYGVGRHTDPRKGE